MYDVACRDEGDAKKKHQKKGEAMKWMSIIGVVMIGVSVYAEGGAFIDSASFGAGQSHDKIDIYRLGLRKDSDFHWFANATGYLSLYYEASLNYWKKGSDEIYGVALSPVFIYYFGDENNLIRPYVEGGIGIAGISDMDIGNRDMTTAFQFEDRVGAGVLIDNKVDLSFRYMHYSNASIKQPNDGIDILIATVGYRF